jgi:hypothetical protein
VAASFHPSGGPAGRGGDGGSEADRRLGSEAAMRSDCPGLRGVTRPCVGGGSGVAERIPPARWEWTGEPSGLAASAASPAECLRAPEWRRGWVGAARKGRA